MHTYYRIIVPSADMYDERLSFVVDCEHVYRDRTFDNEEDALEAYQHLLNHPDGPPNYVRLEKIETLQEHGTFPTAAGELKGQQDRERLQFIAKEYGNGLGYSTLVTVLEKEGFIVRVERIYNSLDQPISYAKIRGPHETASIEFI